MVDFFIQHIPDAVFSLGINGTQICPYNLQVDLGDHSLVPRLRCVSLDHIQEEVIINNM